jgi:hypothetical protein
MAGDAFPFSSSFIFEYYRTRMGRTPALWVKIPVFVDSIFVYAAHCQYYPLTMSWLFFIDLVLDDYHYLFTQGLL